MATQLKKIWQFLNTDLKELCRPTGAVEAGTEVSKTALEFAIALGFLGSSLSPTSIAVAGLSFAGIAAKGIRFYRDKNNKELTLEECVSVAVPLAYLESFDELAKTNDLLRQLGVTPISDIIKQQIEQLGELQINEYLARNALSYFTESELAQAFNQLLLTQLQAAGIKQQEASILTGWVAWGTQRHLIKALQDSEDSVRQLTKAYINGNNSQNKYSSITTYLENQIATKPLEKVFAENFTFQDIYVPLKVQPLNPNGEIDKEAHSVEIEAWAKTILADEQKLDKVMFIQGSPGRGKSVFCRMFADWVRQHLHPLWTPILIRLRDIRTFEKSFEKTLQAAVGWDFSTSYDGWLTDRNTRFLFLLDGFDELLLERGNRQGLKDFLWQIDEFSK